MFENIVKKKIEPATFVLDALYNIVFTNSKAALFLKNKTNKEKLLQLSSTLIEETSPTFKPKKIVGIKVNKRTLSLQIEPLQLDNDTQTFFLFKIEDDINIEKISNEKLNLSLLNKLHKTEHELGKHQKLNENYAKEIGLFNEENVAINEELKNLNTEYATNINRLEQRNKQLNNLLYHANIAAIFLDDQLKVLKYSKAAKKLFYIEKVDLNRSIKDFKNKFTDQNWLPLLSAAFKTKKAAKFNLKTNAGIEYKLLVNFFNNEKGSTTAVLSFNLKTDEDFYYKESILKNNIDAICIYDTKQKSITAVNTKFLTAFEMEFPKKISHFIERKDCTNQKLLNTLKSLDQHILQLPKVEKKQFEYNTSKNNLATAEISCYKISKSRNLIKLRNVVVQTNKFSIGETYMHFDFRYNTNGIVIYNIKNGFLVYANKIFKEIAHLNDRTTYLIYSLITVQYLKKFRALEAELIKKKAAQVSGIISIQNNEFEQVHTKVILTTIKLNGSNQYILVSIMQVDHLYKKALQKEYELQLFETIFEKSSSGIALYNISNQTFSTANNVFLKLFKKTITQIKELAINDLLLKEENIKNFDFTKISGAKKTLTINLVFKKNNNSTFYGKTKLVSVNSKNNKFLIIYIEDVTQQLQLKTQLSTYQKQFNELNKKYKVVLNKSLIGIATYNFDKNCFVEANRKWLNILNYKKHQALNNSITDLFFAVQDDGTTALDLYKKIKAAFNKKGTFKETLKFRFKNNTAKYIDFSISKTDNSKSYAIVILTDNHQLTTQLKHQKNENKILSNELIKSDFYFNFSPNGCAIADINTLSLTKINSKFLETLGIKQKELYDITPKLFFDNAANNISLTDLLFDITNDLKQGKQVVKEIFILKNKKHPYLVKIISTLLPQPNENLFYTLLVDINNEHKRKIENDLNLNTIYETENRFKSIFNAAKDGFAILDIMQLQIVNSNPRSCEMFGYSKTDILNASINTILPKNCISKQATSSYLKKVVDEIAEKRIYKSTDIFNDKKGKDFYAETTIVQLDKLNPNFLFVQFTDKSTEINTQQKSIKVAALYEGLFKNSRNGIVIKNTLTKEIIDVNQRFLDLFEERKTSILKQTTYNYSKLFATTEKNTGYEKVNKLYKQLVNSKIEKFELESIGLKQKSKKAFYMKVAFFKPSNIANTVIMTCADVDNIKKTEQALIEKNKKIELSNKQLLFNEQKFRLTFENANNFIARTKLDGQLIEHNNSAKFNLLNKEIERNPRFIWNFKWFKHKKNTVNQIKQAYKTLKYKKSVKLQISYKISINIKGILELTLTKIYKNKRVDWVLVEGNDITEITNFQNQLILSEQKFKAIYNTSSAFIGIFETNGIIKEHNKKVSKYLEDENTVTTGIYIWDFIWFAKHQATRTVFKEGIKKAAKGETVNKVARYDLPNSPNRYIQLNITPIFDENKKIVSLFGEARDITEAVETNKAKALQQTKINTIFKASKNAIIIFDKAGTIEETNEKGNKIIALAPFKLKNILDSKEYTNHHYKKIHNDLKKQFKKALAGKIVGDTIIYQNSTNNTIGFEYHISPILDADNKVVKILLEFTDVTNKIIDQIKLSESEKKFKAIFYKALNFMARLSPIGIVLEHNRYGHSSISYTYVKDLIGKPIWTDRFLDQSANGIKQMKNDVKQCALGNIISNETDYYFKSNKNPVKLKYTLKPVFSTNKKLIWILIEGTNVSALRNTQSQLNKTLIKSEYFFENSLLASLIIDKDLQVVETNKAFLKITGYTANEVNKIGYFNILYKNDLEKAKKNFNKFKTKRFVNAQYKRRFVSKSKQLKTAIFSFKPFYENGNFNGGYVTISDITELEIKKQQLDDNIKKYKSLFDNNVTGLAVGDKDGKLLKVNKAFCDILGYREKELLQMNRKQLSHYGEQDNSYLLFKDLLADKIRKFTTTKKFVKKNGSVVDTIINVSGIYNDENEFLYDVTSISDISEIRKLEAQLANKVIELEKYIESNLELENFAFLASHDLRAPLVTVLSFTRILKATIKNKISESEYAYLGHISTGVNRLQQSINDLLDFSSVSNNQLKIKGVSTKAWLNNVIEDFDAPIKINNAKIIIKNLPKIINIDESLYTRLIYNLLGNSLKFIKKDTTPKIEINCTSDKSFHKFYFKDNGIGIPKRMQEKVFGIFKRLHPSEVYEGTGIGLALCKKVVERHNGNIWIESEFGKGTTFYFTLPVKQ